MKTLVLLLQISIPAFLSSRVVSFLNENVYEFSDSCSIVAGIVLWFVMYVMSIALIEGELAEGQNEVQDEELLSFTNFTDILRYDYQGGPARSNNI